MDLYCPKCAEPFDTYEFNEVPDMTYSEAFTAFRTKGCGGIGHSCNKDAVLTDHEKLRAEVMDALGDVLGDDLDGLASEMDDFEYLFGS